jgi:hypothetical protein
MLKHTINFRCDCGCTRFSKEYSFEIEFRSVDFSDDLIFTESKSNIFICKSCGKEYGENEIIYNTESIIKSYKEDQWVQNVNQSNICD